jgi:hypothetical protein
MIRRRRRPFYPSGQDDPQIRELDERYHEVDCRVRDDNPRDVVLLKVQRDRWLRNLEKVRGKVAARQYPAVQQLDRLIEDWYKQSQTG